MPSISPVQSLSPDHDKELKEEDNQTPEISGSLKSRFSPSSTFSKRLKAARKLIPSYPGRAKLVRLVSESSTLVTKTDNERIHSRAENKSCTTSQDFGTFFLRACHHSGIVSGFFFSYSLIKWFLKYKATYSDSFRQVLKFMKSCFYSIDTWGATNEQAVNLVHDSCEEFKERAKQCAAEALDLFDSEVKQDSSSDDDGNVLRQKNLSDLAFMEGKRMMLAKVRLNLVLTYSYLL
ncbi:uncharacterized protein LOC111347321 [Stylophora pistillata]|uniref:uncharacterized protein LOC111347321 n=1 Tax=Stylophora pistillata TaxID=50429 RepID=UPI000C03F6BF|nr:uncharacterized protein LOC111347321 [Stylophora pistillata]